MHDNSDGRSATARRRGLAGHRSGSADQPRPLAGGRANPLATLVEPGLYEVAFQGEERRRWFDRFVWWCRFAIVEAGEHQGREIYLFLNQPEGRARHAHDMAKAFVVATGRRFPGDLRRRRPSSFLEGCVFLAQVRTVTKDANGVERPAEASYSRIAFLKKRLDGTPPYLRTEPDGSSFGSRSSSASASPSASSSPSSRASSPASASPSASASQSNSHSESHSYSQSGAHGKGAAESRASKTEDAAALAANRARQTNEAQNAQAGGGGGRDRLAASPFLRRTREE